MTPKQTLQHVVHEKIERQAVLRGISRNLEALDDELAGSKFGRFFGTSYWFVKRWLTLLVGLLLLVLGVSFMVGADVIYESDPTVFAPTVAEYEKMHIEQLKQQLNRVTAEVAASDELTFESVSSALEKTYDSFIVEQIKADIFAFGVLLFLVAVVLLYISRQARKVRERNSAISERETLTQELGRSFQQVIDGEEEELQKLKALMNSLG